MGLLPAGIAIPGRESWLHGGPSLGGLGDHPVVMCVRWEERPITEMPDVDLPLLVRTRDFMVGLRDRKDEQSSNPTPESIVWNPQRHYHNLTTGPSQTRPKDRIQFRPKDITKPLPNGVRN